MSEASSARTILTVFVGAFLLSLLVIRIGYGERFSVWSIRGIFAFTLITCLIPFFAFWCGEEDREKFDAAVGMYCALFWWIGYMMVHPDQVAVGPGGVWIMGGVWIIHGIAAYLISRAIHPGLRQNPWWWP